MEYLSDYVTTTDASMRAVFYVMIVLYVFVIVLIIQVFFFRFVFSLRDKAKAEALAIWMPVLAETTVAIPASIPPLSKKHIGTFLYEWNKLHMLVRGDACERLIILARDLKLVDYAYRMFESNSLPQKMLGIITLGNMKEYSAWDKLMDLLKGPSLILSLTAARALLQIDSNNGIKTILPEIVRQKEWPSSQVSSILKITDPKLLCDLMGNTIMQANDNDLPHLINLTVGNTQCDTIGMAILEVLKKSSDERVIAACLHSIDDVRGIVYVRKYINHPQGFIRVHAANAMGRIGINEDVPALVELLSDPEWWVRYRSAQALVSLPFMRDEDLIALKDQLTDKYARDIFTQAMEEKRFL